MPNVEMKTLTIGDTTYEIVDDSARDSVGDLSELTTTAKTDLVSAINEAAESGGQVDSVNGKTGAVVLAASDVGAATTGALTEETTARTTADAQLQGQITALGNGTPITVETIAAMNDQTKAYLYTGTEAEESTGYWYSYDSVQSRFVPRGEYGAGIVIDDTLTLPGAAAEAAAVRAALAEAGGLTVAQKEAILAAFAAVAWATQNGQTFYNNLYNAFFAVTAIRLNSNSIVLNTIGATAQLTATTTPAGGTVTWSSSDTSIATVDTTGLVTSVAYGTATITAASGSVSATCSITVSQVSLTSISAAYTQSGTVYDNASLDSLKSDLVVTATWSDSTTSTLSSSSYTLSGTLTVGTSTITVTYGGKTATFNVVVSAAPTVSSISAVYTQSGTVEETDTLDSLKADLVVRAHYTDSSTVVVPANDYTLSGTLTVGTSTITVSYSGKTTTFTVNVSQAEVLLFNTYGASNTRTANYYYAPFYIYKTNDPFNYTYPLTITELEFDTNSTGNLYVGYKAISEITSRIGDPITLHETIPVETTGKVKLRLSTPLVLQEGQCLAIGQRSVSGQVPFKYGTTSTVKGFVFYNSGVYQESTDDGIGFNVYGIRGVAE